MSQAEVQDFPEGAHIDVDPQAGRGEPQVGREERTEDERKADEKLAERLSVLIEGANSRVSPLCKTIREVRCVVFRSKYFQD